MSTQPPTESSASASRSRSSRPAPMSLLQAFSRSGRLNEISATEPLRSITTAPSALATASSSGDAALALTRGAAARSRRPDPPEHGGRAGVELQLRADPVRPRIWIAGAGSGLALRDGGARGGGGERKSGG